MVLFSCATQLNYKGILSAAAVVGEGGPAM